MTSRARADAGVVCFAAGTLRTVLCSDLAAFGLATALLCGNSIYTLSLFPKMALLILLLLAPFQPQARMQLGRGVGQLVARIVQSLLVVVLVPAAAMLAKSLLAGLAGVGSDDQHILQLLRCKLHGAGPSCHDFFSLLYLCEGVFGYATPEDITLANQTLLLPAVIAVVVGTLAQSYLPMLGLDWGRPPAHRVYFAVSAIGYALLAAGISRLKYLAVPYLCVCGAAVFTPRTEWMFPPPPSPR